MNKIICCLAVFLSIPACLLAGDDAVYSRDYFESGRIKNQVPIINQKKQGLFYSWREDGKLRYVVPFYQGKMEGAMISFDKDGKVEKISNFVDGTLEGATFYFYPSGILKSLCRYKNGRPEQMLRFDESGIPVD
jgi:antitoxin component YwqK of YwqJK toxin-antitoxin module